MTSAPAPRPPRLAVALLRRALPGDVRDSVLDDLAETFARDCHEPGAARARLRYSQKVPSFATRFLVERARETVRLAISPTDLKLGGRMVLKYPALSIVGGLAIAFAIAVGAAAFEFLNQIVFPTLPLHEGHRVVGIRLWHTASNGVEEQALYDFTTWRGQLTSIDDLGAFRTVDRNLIGADVAGDPVMAAEITASGFTLARVPALLGRTLVEADEAPGAQRVIVIGHDIWQSRFSGEPDVVGRVVNVGGMPGTIVGVMPDGFAFPRAHELWVPLRLDDLQFDRRQGPWVNVFGRLAPGVSVAEAQAELTLSGQRLATAYPETHEHIRPEVLSYTETVSPIFDELSPATLFSINLLFVMLVALVSANIALLLLARAAAREHEIGVRAALGAGRGRIAGQFFAEALVLGSVSAVAGLAAAGAVLRWWTAISLEESGGRLPFWHSNVLSPSTIGYAAALTVAGAAIAGIGSALKVTGGGLEQRLRRSASGGTLRFGGVWTAVIVTQVAVTVAFPASAFFARRAVTQVRSADAGFAADAYVAARLEMSPEFRRGADGVIRAEVPAARFQTATGELARRLSADPAVTRVTFAGQLPRSYHLSVPVEIEAVDSARDHERHGRAGRATVAADYFDALDAPALAGRLFQTADLGAAQPVVIVNESFVRDVLGGRQPVGRRIREMVRTPDGPQPGPWLEVVGVVRDMGVITDRGETAGVYHPVARSALQPVHLIARVAGTSASMAERVRVVAADVDPELRLSDVGTLGEVDRTLWLEMDFLSTLLAVTSAVGLLLSFAGIYAAMSFAVSGRTREIGVRVALGADARRITMAVFRRPLVQVVAGVTIGAVLTAMQMFLIDGRVAPVGVLAIGLYAVLMSMLCLLAGVGPVRRALCIEPTVALKDGG